MRKSWKILGGLLLIAGIGWLVYAWLTPSEPCYQGRQLSSWFRQYCQSGDGSRNANDTKNAEAAATLRAIGTNAVPYLVGIYFNTPPDTAFTTSWRKLLSLLPRSLRLQPSVPASYIPDNASKLLREIMPPAGVLLPCLTNSLASTDASRRGAALDLFPALGDGAEAAEPFLKTALKSTNKWERTFAWQAVETMHARMSGVVPELIGLLQQPGQRDALTYRILRVLGGFGSESAAAIPVLKARLAEEVTPIGRLVLELTLCQIDRNECGALETTLDNVLADQDETLWRPAAEALRSSVYRDLGTNAPPVIPALYSFLSSRSFDVWTTAADGLHKAGVPKATITSKLAGKLATNDEWIRLNTASQMCRIDPGNPEAIAALKWLAGKPGNQQRLALFALGELGPSAREALPLLRELATNTDPELGAAVARALGKIESSSATTSSSPKR